MILSVVSKYDLSSSLINCLILSISGMLGCGPVPGAEREGGGGGGGASRAMRSCSSMSLTFCWRMAISEFEASMFRLVWACEFLTSLSSLLIVSSLKLVRVSMDSRLELVWACKFLTSVSTVLIVLNLLLSVSSFANRILLISFWKEAICVVNLSWNDAICSVNSFMNLPFISITSCLRLSGGGMKENFAYSSLFKVSFRLADAPSGEDGVRSIVSGSVLRDGVGEGDRACLAIGC